MSKFSLSLSYKNIFILKHSLEQRIESEKVLLNRLKGKGITPSSPVYEMYQKYAKEHEEHKRCLEALIKEMKHTGYRQCAKKNIFGEKYL